MATKIRPLADRVVVEVLEGDDTFAGGHLFLPETAKEKPQQAIVLAVGSGRRDDKGKVIALDVLEGDRVLFAKYAGTETKLDGKKVLILKEADIIGVVEPN